MKNTYWRYLAWVVIIMLSFGLGYGISYTKGFTNGVKWAVHTGLQFTTIDVDETYLVNGLLQYKNRIDGCFDIPKLEVSLNAS